MNRMTGMRAAALLGALALGAFSPVASTGVERAMRLARPDVSRGEPTPRRGGRYVSVAAMKRNARKRRNVRARASKRA